MEHIVRYTTASGEDQVEDVGSLDAAIARVEALRNDEGVDNPRLYREVKVEFKTYVRAQVVDEGAGASTASSAPAEAPAPAAADEPAPAAGESSERPSATPSEPPPGAMPLNPQRPTAKVSDAVDDDAEPAAEGDGGNRRTLFSRG